MIKDKNALFGASAPPPTGTPLYVLPETTYISFLRIRNNHTMDYETITKTIKEYKLWIESNSELYEYNFSSYGNQLLGVTLDEQSAIAFKLRFSLNGI